MEELLADLTSLLDRLSSSPHPRYALLHQGVTDAITKHSGPPAQYQYRHRMPWDPTWMDLEPSNIPAVLAQSHTVQRRRIAGDWETVTEAGQ